MRCNQVRVERAKQRRAEATKEEQAAEAAETGAGKKLGRGALQREKKRKRAGKEDEAAGAAQRGNAGGSGKQGSKRGASRVQWGEAEDETGSYKKDLSKPYRERGNKVDGVIKAGSGRRAPAPADPRGAKAVAKRAAAAGLTRTCIRAHLPRARTTSIRTHARARMDTSARARGLLAVLTCRVARSARRSGEEGASGGQVWRRTLG